MNLRWFFQCEFGASAVEYAVALLVVTIIGGAGAVSLGGSTTQLAGNASAVVSAVESESNIASN